MANPLQPQTEKTAKTNGAEFKEYYTDPLAWPEGSSHEDYVIYVNGQNVQELDVDNIKSTDIVEIVDGCVHYSGGDTFDMVWHFNQWREARNIAHLTVVVGVENKAEVLRLIAEISGVISVQ